MPRRDYDDSDLDDRPRRRRRRPVERKQGSNVVAILACIGAFLLLAIAVSVGGYFILRAKTVPIAGIGGGDLERLAGAWECTFRDGMGRVTMHKVKEIVGNIETVTWYGPDGRTFRINRVEFVLETRGQSKVLKYFNGWATDGNGFGGQPFPSGEYAYSLEGDTWTEFDPGGLIIWTRKR
jgi:hypothetical protein